MKILVIDDAATVRGFHREILETQGFTVEEASNGLEGLEKIVASESDYQLVLVDINMPQMDGYQMTRELRQLQDKGDIPVIVISTEADEKDKIKAFQAGANTYMTKPTKPENLLGLVGLMVEHERPVEETADHG